MRDVLRTIRDLDQLLGAKRRWRWAVLVGLALLVTCVELVGASAVYALLALIGPASPGAARELGPLGVILPPVDDASLRVTLAIGIVVFFGLRGILLVGRAYVEGRIAAAATVSIAERLVRGYVQLPYIFHTRRGSAELIRNAHTSTQAIQDSVLRPLVLLIAEGVLVIGLVGLLVATAPMTAALAAVLLAGAVGSIQFLLRPRLVAWGALAQRATTGSLDSLQQAFGGIRDVKLLGVEDAFVADHLQHRRRLARSQYLASTANAVPRSLIEFSLVGTVATVLLITTLNDGAGPGTLSTLGLFAYAGIRLQPSLQTIVNAINWLRYGRPLIADLAADDSIIRADAVRSGVALAVGAEGPGRIEMHNVTLNYVPDDDKVRPALREVNLTVEPGEFVGICGPTGGGKSTLLDVLVGLLPPTAGEVLVDGFALGVRPTWWWRRLGVVSQAVFLTDDTLRRNIAFGVAEGEVDEVRMARCLTQAQLTDLVAEMPEGLDTVVGERGIRLSGGQRQRVAIARALYRDPPVLVLDEGTSALDGATEAAVIRALEDREDGRTLVAVAHRLQTIRHADRIVVMAEGRVAAEGTWNDLMAGSALFRDLAGASTDGS